MRFYYIRTGQLLGGSGIDDPARARRLIASTNRSAVVNASFTSRSRLLRTFATSGTGATVCAARPGIASSRDFVIVRTSSKEEISSSTSWRMPSFSKCSISLSPALLTISLVRAL